MILKDKELIKIFNHLYNRYINYKDITIHTVNLIIGDFIKVKVHLNYYKVDTYINVIAKAEVNDEYIIIDTKGIIKSGFINLDFNKMVHQYLKDKEYFKIEDDRIYIKNEYLRTLKYGNNEIEITLK